MHVSEAAVFVAEWKTELFSVFLHLINRRVYKFVGEWPSRRTCPPPTTTPLLNGNIQAIRKAHTATGFKGEPVISCWSPPINWHFERAVLNIQSEQPFMSGRNFARVGRLKGGLIRHRFLRETFTTFKFLAVKTTWLSRTREVKVSLIREVAFSSWFSQETRGILTNASGTKIGDWRFARCCQVAMTATNNSIALTFTIRSHTHKTHHVVTQSRELSEGVARGYGWHSDSSCLFSCSLLWFRRP